MKFIHLRFIALISFILLSCSARSQQDAQLFASCTQCHGSNGEGNTVLNAPPLAGQFAWYTKQQLLNFKTGIRGSHKKDVHGKQMQVIVSTLSKQDIAIVSTYIEKLTGAKQPSNQTANKANIKKGGGYYQARCGACHGRNGMGNLALKAPKLNHLSAQYLELQISHFRQGIRGTHTKDKLGRQMAMMSKVTPEQELPKIIEYLTQQSQ